MRLTVLLSVLLVACSAAFCPLGFPPEQACPQESPSCALFSDTDDDGLCDNPEPTEVVEEDPIEISNPDTIAIPEEVPDDVIEEDEADPPVEVEEDPPVEPEEADPPVEVEENPPVEMEDDPPVEPEETPIEFIDEEPEAVELIPCPLDYTPAEACPADNPGCALFRDPDANSFCDNPLLSIEGTAVIDPDSFVIDPAVDIACPLGFLPEEACPQDDQKCCLFTDADSSGFCDNPDPVPAAVDSTEEEGGLTLGCPLDLDPEQACHHSQALCPHWYGVTEGTHCSSPLGGTRRLWTVLIGLVILLPTSRILSRRLRGRRISERMARQKAHTIIRAVSIIILGVAVQGCFCPLGAFQYLFIPGGLAFLGVMGVIILVLPILQAIFCGRVFCAWVCPMGGLQEFLYRIHMPGQFSPSGRIHRVLLWLKYVILVGLVAWLIFGSSGKVGQWEALFCRFDPFRTVFTLFVSGSLIIAGSMILLSMFVRRFFCRYLCFYGALLSIFNRAHLIRRLKKRPAVTPEEAEIDSDDEFDR